MTGRKTPRVLLVEDDEDIRVLLSRLLESYGCSVALAASREEVDAHLENGGIALAFIDIMLPSVDGRDIARAMLARNPSFSIYFMTGVDTAHLEVEFAESVAGILRKPFTIDAFRAILDKEITAADTDGDGDPRQAALELMAGLATEHEALRRERTAAEEALFESDRPQSELDVIRRHADCIGRFENLLDRIRNELRAIHRAM